MKSKTRNKLLAMLLVAIAFIMPRTFVLYADTANDFEVDVQEGLKGGKSAELKNIKLEDYQSSWDEFGTNILTDGANPTAEIQKSLINDIANDLQMQITYDQKDIQYLEQRQSSPEEVVAIEGDGGNDLLPENYIEPHPSLDANPDVNPSALDVSTTTIEISETSIIPDVIPSSDEATPLPDNLLPTTGEWKPADITVFENILNADTPVVVTDILPPNINIAPPSDVPPEPTPAPTPEPTTEPTPTSPLETPAI